MRRTAFSIALAAEMFIVTGIAAAQPGTPAKPPANPGMPATPPDRIDPAERDKMQKEWDSMKKEWDALTPEARILSVIHTKNIKEVELGRLGQEKGTSQGVKEYAAMMVKDHTEADNKLTTLATTEKITLWDTDKTSRALMLKKMFDRSRDGERKKDNHKDDHPGAMKPGMTPDGKPKMDGTGEHMTPKDPAEKLRALNGDDFDNAFAHVMYTGHGELLAMLEKTTPLLTNTNVKPFVSDVTSTVRKHRDEAGNLPGAKDTINLKPREPAPHEPKNPR